MRRRALLAAPLLVALGGCAKKATNATTAAVVKPAVTSGGGTIPLVDGKVRLGAYVSLKGLTATQGLALRRKQLGRSERIVHRYYAWTDELPESLSYVPSTSYLMVSWRGTHYADITDGSSDELITAAAKRIAARKRPTFLRWGWDMNNRDFYVWGGKANGDNPAGYIAAYRRIHQIFKEEGATNVAWVWSPNCVSDPDDDWNKPEKYYPGDDYVDWIGVSGYATTETPDDLFGAFYDQFASVKPVMIAEVAVNSEEPAWIASFASWVKARPAIGAVVWFDTDDQSGAADKWRIDTSTASLAAYKAMAGDKVFGG